MSIHRNQKIDPFLEITEQTIEGVTLIQINDSFYGSKYRQYKNQEKRISNNTLTKGYNIQSIIKDFLPDEAAFWYRNAMKKGRKLLNENDYSIILSVSHPNICHIIGYQLSRQFSIPHILEYGDLWSIAPIKRGGMKNIVDHWMEREIIQNSRLIIFTTNQICNLYSTHFPQDQEKMVAIYSGYDNDDLKQIDSINYTESKIRLIHVGQIHEYRDNLKPLINSINKIYETSKNIELIFVGNIKSSDFNTNKRYIKKIGQVDINTSLGYMKSADILILFGNKYGLQIPMKTYFYIGMNKPILAILGDEKDPLKKLLSDCKQCHIVENKQNAIYYKLIELLNPSNDIGNQEGSVQNLEQFQWNVRLEKMQELLSSILKQ